MNRSHIQSVVETACLLIESATGTHPVVQSRDQISGGSINQALRLATDIGDFFVKYQCSKSAFDMFEAEAQGLKFLRQGPLNIPTFIGCGRVSDTDCGLLVLEWIQAGQQTNLPADSFWEQFGRQLAELHSKQTLHRFGFDRDNWIGLTTQPNGWSESWIGFWRENRLAFQLRLARDNRLLDVRMQRMGDSLCNKLESILTEPAGKAALLHGDLWSGNFLCDSSANPVLIDPAVYYGHSEAEFGMIMLFGGFDQRFFEAYNEVLAFDDGFADRIEIYKLYHLLNHLNLFGSSYQESCRAILQRFT